MYKLLKFMTALMAGLTSFQALAQSSAAPPVSDPQPQGMQLDLESPFRARSPWRLVVTEGPPAKDFGGNDAPGALTLCLYKRPAGSCVSDPVTLPLRAITPKSPIAWEPHYLLAAKVVYPKGPTESPLLLIVTGSLNSGDGDQVVSTQLISYNFGRDEFQRIYSKRTGHNNNEEVRFLTDGPLRGSIIGAEPQQRPPYGYWIVVNELTSAKVYRPVLRYRSATLYNDGNPLAVIDSEMPNIERQLGLWKPGEPLPTPRILDNRKPCTKPVLKHTELWCEE